MNSLRISLLALLTIFLFTFTACDDDDVVVDPPEELITTLNYILSPTGGGSPITLSFIDLDGDGGNDPVITSGILTANTVYTGAVTLFNDTENPVKDITAEIEEEDEEHQFFFSSSISGLTIAATDTDANGNPVGLASTLATTDAGTGTLTIILRHEPDKNASGVSDGDITNAGGETDIEVTFDITIQ